MGAGESDHIVTEQRIFWRAPGSGRFSCRRSCLAADLRCSAQFSPANGSAALLQ